MVWNAATCSACAVVCLLPITGVRCVQYSVPAALLYIVVLQGFSG